MSDLPPSTEYGERAEMERQLSALPMGSQPGLTPPPSLTAPSARPSEPVQAGLPMGPGPGPEALGTMGGAEVTVETLRALRRRYPSPTLDAMLKHMMDRA